MAVAQGKSLKAYIESILISKADSINVEVKDRVSPSGDDWFDKPENMSMVQEGIVAYENSKTKPMTMDEIREMLGV